MKPRRLTLIRHAKSSWDGFGLSDHDRPLASRGLRDAPLMGEYHRKPLHAIEQFYCSTAKRANQTLSEMVKGAGLDHPPVIYVKALYTFDAQQVIDIVSELPDHFYSVALVGHNPAFTETVNYFTDAEFENMPTAAIAQIQFDVASWQSLKRQAGELVLFARPKDIR
jgi:phosphohistidine phosphatase